MYKALTQVGLPVHEEREVWPGIKVPVPTGESVIKQPGDKISKKELTDHGQTDEDIARLLKGKAIEEAGA